MGTSSARVNSGPRKIAVTSVKVEQETLDAFKVAAAGRRRTVSQQIRWLIDRDIKEFAQEEAA